MASPPPNPDTRALPYGWTQQFNWDYGQWYYVNTREQPPRSSWEHPLGPLPQPPLGPPPDRSYNRSPYGGPPQQGYGGPQGYQPPYPQSRFPPQGYYNPPQGGFGGPAYDNRGGYPQQQVFDDRRQQRKGPGIGTALLAGGAGLVGGALLMDAVEDHDERERQIGYDDGYDNGFQNGADWGGDGGFF